MQQDNNQENEKEVHQGVESFVVRFKNMPTTQKLAMVAFSIIMLCVMIFIVFFSNNSNSPTKEKIKVPQVQVDTESSIVGQIAQNIYSQKESNENVVMDKVKTRVTELKPPAPPKLEVIEEPKPTIQPLPIQPQQVTQPKLPLPASSAGNKVQNDQAAKKASSSIMAFGGGSVDDKKNGNDKQAKNSEFLGFDGGMIDNLTLQPSSAQSVVATKVNNDLKYTLLQGKVIDAVLETAINTQMSSGIIRAVISRDVYGEHGDLVLIPKGSRVVGSYSASSSSSGSSGGSQTGQVSTRVYAVWKRIITPSGVDINLPDTPSSDPLGRSGIPGYLDTNLSNNLMNAFLLSVLGPYIAIEASGIGKQSTTTTNTNNAGNNGAQITTSGSVGAQVLTQGLQDFQSVAQAQIDAIYPPGVTTTFVDQGARIDIMVQQDIVFPKQSIQLNSSNLP